MRIEVLATDDELQQMEMNHDKVLTIPFNDIRITNAHRTYQFENKKVQMAAIVGNLSGERKLLISLDQK